MSYPMSPAALDTAAVSAMVSVMGRYTLEALLDSEQRAQHKHQCVERLRCNDGQLQHASEQATMANYAEQAVLANLDWGIDALEEAIRTSNNETKIARLDHAEKMLQVCALLDCRATTAGVANSYLSAWAHLNLAFVWKLRNSDHKAANHTLEMFIVDPFYSRVDFSPALWEHLFLPHLSNIVNWYSKQRQSIVISGFARKQNEEHDNSFSTSTDFAPYNELQINLFNLSTDQTSQLQSLEKLYQDSLDQNTRQYARYYKGWLNYDPANKRGMPLMPIAEPPTTPQQASQFLPTMVVTKITTSQKIAPQRPRKLEPVQANVQDFAASGQTRVGLASLNDDPDSPNSNFRKPATADTVTMIDNAINDLSDDAMDQSPESVHSTLQPGRRNVGPVKSFTLTSGGCIRTSSSAAMPAPHQEPPSKQSGIGSRESVRSKVSPGNSNVPVGSPNDSSIPDSDLKGRTPSQSPSGTVAAATAAGMARGPIGSTFSNPLPMSSEVSHNTSNSATTARQLTTSKSGRYNEMGTVSTKNPVTSKRYTDDFYETAKDFSGGYTASTPTAPMYSPGTFNAFTASTPSASLYSPGDSTEESSDSETGSTRFQDKQPISRGSRGARSVRSQPRRYAGEVKLQLENMSGRIGGSDDERGAPSLLSRSASGITAESHVQHPSGSPSESSASTIDYQQDQRWGAKMGLSERQHHRTASLSSTLSGSGKATPVTRPPKDFVCPITNQLFNDPVTLETGQTFERTAIQEWLDRGKTTCPITRHVLQISALPRTNYVLKRVVDSWKEQHPELAIEFGSSAESPVMLTTVQQQFFSGSSPIKIRPSKSLKDFGERSPNPYSPSSVSSFSSLDSSEKLGARRFSRRTLSLSAERSSPPSPEDIDGLLVDLRPAIGVLCNSEDLVECESMVLEISRAWQEVRGDPKLVTPLSKAGVSDGLMAVLSNSTSLEVLRATLYLLSGLIDKDDLTRQILIRVDPNMDVLMGILKKGLTMAVVVLYQLKLPIHQLELLDLLPLLVLVIKQSDENRGALNQDDLPLVMTSKTAAVMLLEQVVTGGDQATSLQSAQAILALQAVPPLVNSLESENMEERTSVVSLLLLCMQSDGKSRHLIAQLCNLIPVVELLHRGSNRARTVTISFLAELVHLHRRTSCAGILQALKKEGMLSSMHVLLVHLQMAPIEQKPVAAGLLLQLDLLEEPRKRSMYREEAVEALIEALINMDDPASQIEAAKTLMSLGGRYSYSGKSMMEPWLLKTAGLEKSFLSFVKDEPDGNDQLPEEEERVARLWERRVAGALAGHDLGALIEALGQGIQSKNLEISKPSMVVATWLTYLLPVLPDTGIRQIARNCLLDHFVGVLQTSKELSQRVLSALAIYSFISDQEGIDEVLSYAKDICGQLRLLKKSTWVAKEILRAFNAHAPINNAELWIHAEQGQLDTSSNGEVRALNRAKTRMFSGHSDGTVKVWDARKRFPVLIQEIKEHSKSVTSLAVSVTAERLYSGSLDKTIRVWALGVDEIRAVHVFDLKEAIMGLVVNGPMAVIRPQGTGIKVQYEETATKTLNQYKHVQSLAISGGKIYCGCTDNSIQEIDPIAGSTEVIQHGIRTLLGKKAIYSIHVSKGLLYTAGSPVDGVAGKIRKLSDYSLVGTLSTTAEVRSMAVSEDFIYLGSSTGIIEVWLRDRLLKVTTMNAGSKIITLMLDGDILYSGSEDGKIRAWTMR